MTRKSRPYRDALLKALADPVEAEHYLNAALDDSEEMFRKACLNVIKAGQVAKVAREAEVTRESLYRSFSASGNPSLSTLNAVLESVGLKFRVVAEVSESRIGTTCLATFKSSTASPDLLDAAVRKLAELTASAERPERKAGSRLNGLDSSEQCHLSAPRGPAGAFNGGQQVSNAGWLQQCD